MKGIKRIIALWIALLMCLSVLGSCADNGDSNQPGGDSAGDTGVSSQPSTTPTQAPPDVAPTGAPKPEEPDAVFAEHIDIISDNTPIALVNPFAPAGTGVGGCLWTYIMIYDRLVHNNGNGTFGPDLATRWETDDYQTFTFFLRDDVFFHNGDKFTAADVIWTATVSREGVGSQGFDVWRPVAEVTAINEYTVQIVLNSVDVDFLFKMSQPYSGIVNERAMKEDSENGVHIGTGAFYINEFVTNDYVSFVRNDNYWSEPPITQSIKLQFIPEMSARTIMMLNGEAQMCFRIGDEDMVVFEEDPGFNIFPVILNTPHPIYFNMDHPICGDYNFRMAVASALEKDEIASAAGGNYALANSFGTFWSYNAEFQNNDIPEVPFDLEAAARYLEASTYNGETIELTASVASCVRASEVIQRQLRRIGIVTDIKVLDPPAMSVYGQYGNNQIQMCISALPMEDSAASYKNVVYPEGSFNRTQYNNPIVNEMLDRAESTIDVTERERLYMEAQRIVMEDPPFFGLFWRMTGIVAVQGIGGMVLPSTSYYDLRNIFLRLDY